MIKTKLDHKLAGGVDDDDVVGVLRPIETGEVGDGGVRGHGGFLRWGFEGAWGSPGLGFSP
jgi:hypothetical protein